MYKTVSNMLGKLIVCLTGMPGAGKSTIAEGLKAKGHKIINMGDVVRAEAKNRNLEPTGANLGRLMLELREKNGPGAIAELVKGQIEDSEPMVIIDGIRSGAEIEVLKKCGNVKLLAVHASADTRFSFLQHRGRPDDPHTKEHFEQRDGRELGIGISNSIALSEEVVTNNNKTREELIDASLEIINNWLK